MEVSIRRKLAVLAALLVAVAACSAGTDRQLQELYDSGTRELLQGELDRARERADQGLRLSSNRQQGSPWTWKFRLLHDEIRLIDRQLSAPFPALDEAVPQADDYAWVRARQRYLKGQHHLVRGDLPAAIAAFGETARLAKAASGSDVLVDADILKGVALVRAGQSAEGDAMLAGAAALQTRF